VLWLLFLALVEGGTCEIETIVPWLLFLALVEGGTYEIEDISDKYSTDCE